ncbi:D-2-hydroxyacid dehydrogenase family protein [Vibrio navarrensis]|nr:D-2-hydroxyacid dehydrogenase family protein [Vibrio navarrensis]
MKIAILDDYQDQVRRLSCFSLLDGHQVTVFNQTINDETTLAQRLQPFEALVLIRERTPITAYLLRQLPNLQLISQTGKISNHLDLAACTQANVAVAEGIGSPIAPAELCWALIMAARRQLPQYFNNLQRGRWQQSDLPGLGQTLHGQTLGIWGYGKIGQMIAQFGRTFGMQVLIWGSDASRQKAQQDGFDTAKSKSEFFCRADVLSLHLRLNDATRGIVTQADLAQMKSGSLFVNTSRAELVQTGALYQQMADNPDKFAAVDVYEQEPANAENQPLLTLPNLLASPHLGYVEQNSYELYFRCAFENINAFANGKAQNIANPETLTAQISAI